ncbi:polymorphic toxin type 47 domain-containing protein [Pseudomonas sp. Irchel 3F3]|uniref:polymorphic toxin type 47 domain-containing protein n=1 Tax=Pseudomonas sp. Irchel 3F3 TaxID=2009000 RepID=UPI00211592C2|nr:polymorphic toxin type 47 domain-containing protein [Pseudomonas sp. Irchel 3F3]
MLEASLNYDKELFAFDPASNLLDPQAPPGPNPHSPRRISDNVLRSYCGTQYRYDERGNLLERIENGKTGHFTWDLYNRLRRYEDDRLIVDFAYDALGRRLYKNSRSKYRDRPQAGPVWNENARWQRDEELGCGFTWFTWEGDTLATECHDREERGGSTTHYVFEPGTFVPVAQAVINSTLELIPQPTYGDHYNIDRDPVWLHRPTLGPINTFAWYQCDQLGTPIELTAENGQIAWTASYKAWGLAKEKRREQAQRAEILNPLRFQGQFFDTETNLHYNRHRYYDPSTGRFIGKDPIGFAGGLNAYAYTPNPTQWTDPLGLAKLDHAADFDTARRMAFKNAGMDDPDKISFTKNDPETGTIVEFKGPGGGKVAYDAPHADMDAKSGHDKPHIGWQTAGKRNKCGCGDRGNITYSGPQHPHRSDQK